MRGILDNLVVDFTGLITSFGKQVAAAIQMLSKLLDKSTGNMIERKMLKIRDFSVVVRVRSGASARYSSKCCPNCSSRKT